MAGPTIQSSICGTKMACPPRHSAPTISPAGQRPNTEDGNFSKQLASYKIPILLSFSPSPLGGRGRYPPPPQEGRGKKDSDGIASAGTWISRLVCFPPAD